MHRYIVHRRLGCGFGGECVLAEEREARGGRRRSCVLKRVPLASLSRRSRRRALLEAHILQSLEHPNVLRIRRAFVHEDHLVIDTAFCDAGDLEVLIARRRELAKGCRRGFSEAAALGVLVQALRGARYIHGREVVHRDLKASNVLLTHDGVVLLGDFGVARVLPRGRDAEAGRVVGSVSHWPPEVCGGGACTKPGDCWALGVLLYTLCALRLPFAGSCALAVVLSITEGRPAPLPSAYSRGLHDLCAALLRVDPARRLTAAGALSSPLLRAAQLEPEGPHPHVEQLEPEEDLEEDLEEADATDAAVCRAARAAGTWPVSGPPAVR